METETASRLNLSGFAFDLNTLLPHGERFAAFVHEHPVMGGCCILASTLIIALVIYILTAPVRMWARSKSKKRKLVSLLSRETYGVDALPLLHELARLYGKAVVDPISAAEKGFVVKRDEEGGEEEEIFVPSRFVVLDVPKGQTGAVKALFRDLGKIVALLVGEENVAIRAHAHPAADRKPEASGVMHPSRVTFITQPS